MRQVHVTDSGTEGTIFTYDGGQVVLQFDKAGTSSMAADDLSHRYLWGEAVDQLFADEQVTSLGSAGEVLWAQTDNIGSVRDMIDSDGTLRLHRAFDSYGNVVDETHYDTGGDEVTSEDPGYVDEAFAFTGRWFDKATGLQNNLFRWYDPTIGSWLSEDPLPLPVSDANPYRYANNQPTTMTDPLGLSPSGPAYAFSLLALPCSR